MINFRDIPTQKEKSYVFVSTPSLEPLTWQLDKNGIAYNILYRSQADRLPKGIEFPNTVPFLYELDRRDERPTTKNKVCCIVSHLNKNAFIQRIREMNGTFDPEYFEHVKKEQKEYRKTEECISHMHELEQGANQ